MRSFDWKYQPPEFKILWNYASGLIAYTTITPLCYTGSIAASEYGVYNAGKVYVCLKLVLSYNTGAAVASPDALVLYDMANANFSQLFNNTPVWNTTGAVLNYTNNNMILNNFWFSRITVTNFVWMNFIGYRLNV